MAVDWAVAKDKYKDTQPASAQGKLLVLGRRVGHVETILVLFFVF